MMKNVYGAAIYGAPQEVSVQGILFKEKHTHRRDTTTTKNMVAKFIVVTLIVCVYENIVR